MPLRRLSSRGSVRRGLPLTRRFAFLPAEWPAGRQRFLLHRDAHPHGASAPCIPPVLAQAARKGSNLSSRAGTCLPSVQPGRTPPRQGTGLCSLGHQAERASPSLLLPGGAEGKGERRRKLRICITALLFGYSPHTGRALSRASTHTAVNTFLFRGKLGQLHLDTLVKIKTSYFVGLNGPRLRLCLASKQLRLPELQNEQHRLPFFVPKVFLGTGHCPRYNAGLLEVWPDRRTGFV